MIRFKRLVGFIGRPEVPFILWGIFQYWDRGNPGWERRGERRGSPRQVPSPRFKPAKDVACYRPFHHPGPSGEERRPQPTNVRGESECDAIVRQPTLNFLLPFPIRSACGGGKKVEQPNGPTRRVTKGAEVPHLLVHSDTKAAPRPPKFSREAEHLLSRPQKKPPELVQKNARPSGGW